MNTKLIKLFTLVFFLMPLISFAQIDYGMSLAGGVSNIYVLDLDDNSKTVNYFRPYPKLSVGGFIIERISNSRYSFEQGISFERSGSVVWLPLDIYEDLINEGYEAEQSCSFNTYQVSVPLKMKYDFENWLAFVLGINNTFYLTDYEYFVNRFYAIGGILGADIKIGRKFVFGLQCNADFSHTGKCDESSASIFYHYYGVSAKFSVLLGSFKK